MKKTPKLIVPPLIPPSDEVLESRKRQQKGLAKFASEIKKEILWYLVKNKQPKIKIK